ncbi:MAG: hypothetical protein AAGC74_13735 [Verrucomicrobiota bacterium]
MTFRDHLNNALNAWFLSAALAVLAPPLLWLAASLGFQLIDPALLGFIIAISVPFHAFVYALFGIPLFLFCFNYPRSWMWHVPFACIIGAICAGVGTYLLKVSLESGPFASKLGDFKLDPIFLYLALAYGLLTGLAASACRPRPSSTLDSSLPDDLPASET